MTQTSHPSAPSLPSVVQMILLTQPLPLDPASLQQSLQQRLNAAGINVHASPGNTDSLVVSWGEASFAVMSLDQPIPAGTFKTPLRISFGLQDGEQRIAAHHAHLIVSPISGAKDSDQAIRNAIGTLQLAGALADHAEQSGQSGVTAHYWSSAQVLTSPDGFAHACTRADAALAAHQAGQADAWSGLPLNLWLGMHLIPDQKAQGYGVTSEGLRSLTGFEIAIAPYQAEAADVARHLFNIVGYLLGSGARFNDGDTLGISSTEQFRAKNLPAEGEQPPMLVLFMEAVQ